MQLLIGSKNSSSWSMRVWMAMREAAIPFEEVNVRMRSADAEAQRLRALLPAGKVPCLIDGDTTIWETLAILEYLAELYPDKGLWPADRRARAHARAISNEMHAGFALLRQSYPMRMSLKFAPREREPEVVAEVVRVTKLWNEAREKFADKGQGPFLYGAFSAADGMFAPVVARFHCYSVDVDAASQAYLEAIKSTAGWRAWVEAARTEPWNAPLGGADTIIENLRSAM